MGDFLNKRVDIQFTQPWDHWLQNGITALRSKHGGQADEWLLTFPIWRFFVRAGTFDQYHWLGVFAPSADRVNRIFPFTVVTPLSTSDGELSACQIQLWLDGAQDAVQNILANDDLPMFEKNISDLPFLTNNRPPESFEDRFASAGFSEKIRQGNFSSLWWTDLIVPNENVSPDSTQAMHSRTRFELCDWNGPFDNSLFERLMAL